MSARAVVAFVVLVVGGTTLVVLVIHAVSGSWATGVVVGAVAGGVSAAFYPTLVRRRR